MEPYGEVGVLMNLGGDNTGGEILKSLLTSTKMQKSESVKVNILQDLNTRTEPEEQIVFQIELGQPIKSEFIPNGENIIQHIPVTYLTANGSNLTPTGNGTVVEPVTYVLSDTGRYCAVGSDDPQKVFLVQEVDSESQTLYGGPAEGRTYAVKESQTNECTYPGVWSAESCALPVLKREGDGKANEKEQKKRKNPKIGRRNEEETLGIKTKSERNVDRITRKKTRNLTPESNVSSLNRCRILTSLTRGSNENGNHRLVEEVGMNETEIRIISTGKKPLAKRKNSKLKGKVKTSGKSFPAKTPKKSGRAPEQEEGAPDLFELTKLEDNVDQVARRLKIGCECSDSNCFDGLNPGEVFKHRLNIADLTKAEHDMYLMGVIMASIHNLEETCRHKERIRIRSCYAYQGKKVCLTAFLYLQHVTLYQMKRLRSHLKNHGVSPRIHGNRGRKPANTFSLEIYRRATNFVQNYIEEHCVKAVTNFTTACTPAGKTESGPTAVKKEKRKTGVGKTSYHLPPECTKRNVHGEYKLFCESFKPSQKVMKYSTFTNFLKKQFPNVKFHKREEKKVTGKAEGAEEGERKSKEEQGVDKSVQVDKLYVSPKEEIVAHGQRMELYEGNGGAQPGFGVSDQVLVGGQSYDVGQSQNSEELYGIDSTV